MLCYLAVYACYNHIHGNALSMTGHDCLHLGPWLNVETYLDLCLDVVESDLEQKFKPEFPELVADTTVITQPLRVKQKTNLFWTS